MEIKNREVIINKDERAIDWAEAFAKVIVGNDIHKWLSDRDLYKNKKDCSNPPVRTIH